jgi:hypothetical protein
MSNASSGTGLSINTDKSTLRAPKLSATEVPAAVTRLSSSTNERLAPSPSGAQFEAAKNCASEAEAEPKAQALGAANARPTAMIGGKNDVDSF